MSIYCEISCKFIKILPLLFCKLNASWCKCCCPDSTPQSTDQPGLIEAAQADEAKTSGTTPVQVVDQSSISTETSEAIEAQVSNGAKHQPPRAQGQAEAKAEARAQVQAEAKKNDLKKEVESNEAFKDYLIKPVSNIFVYYTDDFLYCCNITAQKTDLLCLISVNLPFVINPELDPNKNKSGEFDSVINFIKQVQKKSPKGPTMICVARDPSDQQDFLVAVLGPDSCAIQAVDFLDIEQPKYDHEKRCPDSMYEAEGRFDEDKQFTVLVEKSKIRTTSDYGSAKEYLKALRKQYTLLQTEIGDRSLLLKWDIGSKSVIHAGLETPQWDESKLPTNRPNIANSDEIIRRLFLWKDDKVECYNLGPYIKEGGPYWIICGFSELTIDETLKILEPHGVKRLTGVYLVVDEDGFNSITKLSKDKFKQQYALDKFTDTASRKTIVIVKSGDDYFNCICLGHGLMQCLADNTFGFPVCKLSKIQFTGW